ncbi:MAG: FAD/FMN-containing dehydrogenase [Gammaproteobacteria bacterium]
MKKLIAVLPFLFVALAANAEPYRTGSRLFPFTLQDQFDQKHRVDENTRLILFSKDMDGNKVLKEALSGKKAEYLTAKSAVYVNDISGMPGIITFLFAKPKMRGYDYPMLLDDQPSATKDFPSKEKRATLIYLDNLEIKSIEITKKPEDVVKALESLN